MSRSWKEHNFISADDFWMTIEEISNKLQLQIESELGNKSDAYKMFLAGKSELLERIIDFVHDNEKSLGEIAKDLYLPLKEKDNE